MAAMYQEGKMKVRVPKAVTYTAITVILLLLFIVVGGAAYTYFLGPDASQAPAPKPLVTKSSALPPPSKPSPNIPASASVQSLTSPITPGANASITVRTVATASCTIEVVYGGKKSTDSGLVKRVADDYGMVTWAWTVDADAPLGTAPVNVYCTYNGKSAYVRGDLVVEKASATVQ